MRWKITILALVFFSTPAVAQEEPGFFSRLFGTDEASTDEEQGGILETFIEDTLSGDGRTVSISGFEGALSGRAMLDSLSIADTEGEWLTLTDVVLDWNRGALFKGRLEVTELSVRQIQLPRLPAPSEEAATPTPEASGFALPELPVSVAIESISADRVFIGEPVYGAETDVSLTGNLSLEGGEGSAGLKVAKLDGTGGVSLETSYSNTTNILALNFDLNEAPGGILAGLTNLPGTPSVALTVTGSAPITEYAADIRLATDGAERLTGRIETGVPDGAPEGSLTTRAAVSGDITPLFNPDYRPFFGTDVRAGARITTFGDGRAAVDDLAISSASMNLSGAVEIGADGLPDKIGLTGEIASEQGPVLLPLAGPPTRVDVVSLDVNFDADRNDTWVGTFRISGLDRAGFSAETLELEGEGRIISGSEQSVSAALNFAAKALDLGDPNTNDALGETVTGQAKIDWSTGAPVQLSNLKIDGETYNLAGAASVTFTNNGPEIDGDLNARATDLSALSGLAGRELGGSIAVDTEFDVAPLAGFFDVTAKGSSTDLIVSHPQADQILSGTARLDIAAKRDLTGIEARIATLESPNASLSGQVSLKSDDSIVSLSGNLRDASLLLPDAPKSPIEVTLNARQTGADWPFILNTSLSGAKVKADGIARDPFGNPSLEGDLLAEVTDLSEFAALAKRPLKGAATLDASGTLSADLNQFDLTADLSGQNLGIGQTEADRLLAGRLTLNLEADRTGDVINLTGLTLSTDLLSAEASGRLASGNSDLSLSARLSDVAPFAPGFSGPLSLTGTVGQQTDERLTVNLAAEGPGGATATAAGGVTPDFGTLDLTINGQLPIGLANTFIAPRAASGTMGFDLAVNGPPALSSVSGQLSSTDARLIAPTLGVVLNNVGLTATLANQSADILVTSNVEDGGRVSVTGPVELTSPFDANLGIAFERVVLRDPRLYETEINGQLTVDGPLTGNAQIVGALGLGETNIRIPSSGLGGAGAVPEITHLNEPPPVRGTRRRAGLLDAQTSGATAGPGLGLDISVDAPNRIFIRGRGLDSEFGGNLRITGDTSNVVPLGGFELIRGRLDILGQRLALEEANVTIEGSFVPTVLIRASTQSDEYAINVLVDGPASDPDITFMSEPELPQEEVISRLIFGRGLETLSAIQAARLALAVRTLAGQGGEGVVGNIRKGAGLADLDVTTDEQGNAAVRAGAYLGENIYTDVTVGASGETELNLNLDLTRSITVKGEVTDDGDTAIGIFFERDY